MDILSEVLAPPFLPAGEVISEEAGVTVPSVDDFAIGYGRSGVEEIRFMGRIFFWVSNVFLPEEFAGGAIEAQEGSRFSVIGRLSEKDTIIPDDGRGITGSR